MREREYKSADYARVAQEIRDRYIHNESATAAKIMNEEKNIILDALEIMGDDESREKWDPEGYTRQNMSHLRGVIARMEIRLDAGKLNARLIDRAKQIDDIVEIGGITHEHRLERIKEILKNTVIDLMTGE